ncbi:endonuclease/exonuclease/phosphatase family protein [Telmatocola sphagniphila]|uniref:Endonuclease/exonuclease/phosphatase family protein n=1 Tax=Telmatocola sphagniphila TaxID=1123043 RepID=A0A8E6B259_9BACT|nr:endonuclease/exonuclease/phosphatase family protein [Telmatocola sphagniphila]QVL29874.1 endonuclease/exonuclease/phosphatase family protein [Telmatocola sphagniphila]
MHSIPAGMNPHSALRLISYNVHKGIGGLDRLCQLDRVCRVIEHENPDLYCLQEVTRHSRRSHYQDQPKIFAERFQTLDSTYQMNVHYQVGGYGNLILSRWPIRSRHHISLRLGQKKPRGAQLVTVETPQGSLHLINFHLGLTQHERHWQIRHLLNHPLFRESTHLPTLMVGDCNDWRDRLGELFSERGYQAATTGEKRFNSFPAFHPLMALDKAFHCQNIQIKHSRVVRSRLAHRASDHLPLVIDFDLRTPQSSAEQKT